LGQLDFLCNKEYSAIILCFVILVFPTGSGILGMLFGMLFKKYCISRPFPDEYYNAVIWMNIFNFGLSAGPKILLHKDENQIFTSIIISTLIGLFFVKLTRIFDKSKSKEIKQTS
jgi:hypothetical protein